MVKLYISQNFCRVGTPASSNTNL